jgi:hypothetical protein
VRTRTTRLVRLHCGRRVVNVHRRIVRTTVIRTHTTHHNHVAVHTTVVHHRRHVVAHTVTRRTVTVSTVITKALDTQIVDRFSVKVANRRCDEDDTECINRVKQQAIDRETTFRRNALKACACRSAARTRCNKASGRCYRRRLYRCRSRCLRRACRSRARSACNGKRSCARRRSRRCVRLHLKISKRYARWKKFARRAAVRKCGRGAAQQSCRRQYVVAFFLREQSFRATALRNCNCVAKAATRCNKNSGRCFTRRNRRCRRRCLRRAIKARVSARCSSRHTGVKRCVRRSTRRLTRLHCRRTVAVIRTAVVSHTVAVHTTVHTAVHTNTVVAHDTTVHTAVQHDTVVAH